MVSIVRTVRLDLECGREGCEPGAEVLLWPEAVPERSASRGGTHGGVGDGDTASGERSEEPVPVPVPVPRVRLHAGLALRDTLFAGPLLHLERRPGVGDHQRCPESCSPWLVLCTLPGCMATGASAAGARMTLAGVLHSFSLVFVPQACGTAARKWVLHR
jgi:hypothetical protein